jgi:uncharacterized alkaline shock family protein YloU
MTDVMSDTKMQSKSGTGSQPSSAPKRIDVKDNPSGIGGSITLDEDVVATIAGLAAKEIDGIYSVGKSSWYQFGDNPARGVNAEVGQIQAAFDLDVVIEYGYDVREVAKKLREKTAAEVAKMAGREVVELNVHVVDIHLPDGTEHKSRRVL